MDTVILDAHRLREILHYDQQTGVFRWKVILFKEHDMAIRIERTNGLVLMSPDELHAVVAQKDGEIVIRLSADALHRPGAFFRIHSENREEADFPLGKACGITDGTCEDFR